MDKDTFSHFSIIDQKNGLKKIEYVTQRHNI